MIRKFGSWCWSNLGNIVQIVTWIGAFLLSAWAVKTAQVFSQYAPASWVVAGLIGLLIVSTALRILSSARSSWVRSKYDNAMMVRGGLVDPLANTFEGKRIYLNEFALPSHPHIEGKIFRNCEIIGPGNIYLVSHNRVDDPKMPVCDAVVLPHNVTLSNAFMFKSCYFRGCSFQRITFFVSEDEYAMASSVDWFRWVSKLPEPELPFEVEVDVEDGSEPPLISTQGDEANRSEG